MNKVFEFEVKSVYGVDKIYPVNVVAQTFALLTKTKTFSAGDLANIAGLGFELKQAYKAMNVVAA